MINEIQIINQTYLLKGVKVIHFRDSSPGFNVMKVSGTVL